MKIVCQHCEASYEIDPPATSFAGDRDLMFRCTSCGRTIALRMDASGEAVPRDEKPAEGEVSSLLLRQEGKAYHVRDLAMLQRWIAERRVLRTDEVSTGDGTWEAVGDREDMEVFFALLDAVDRAEHAPAGVHERSSTETTDLFAAPQSGGDLLLPVDLSSERQSEEEPAEIEVGSIPDEEPALLSLVPNQAHGDGKEIGPDDPTMDMSLEEEDFFSEEHTVLDATDKARADTGGDLFGDDDEADLEWMVQRRKNMALWWVLFMVGLGGSGYLALEYLNDADTAAAIEPPAELVADAEPEAPAEEEVTEPEAAQGDSGATPEAVAEAEEPAVADAASEEAEAEAEAEAAPEPTPQPTPKPKVTAASAVDAGWSAVDRERWSTARKHFNTALQVSPGNGDARFGLAYVTENEGQTDKAIEQYCRLVRSSQGSTRSEAEGRIRALRGSCN